MSDGDRRRFSVRAATIVLVGSFVLIGVLFGLVGKRRIEDFVEERKATVATLTSVVGEYCVTSLAFDDPMDAEDAMGHLDNFVDVQSAALYRTDGSRFAVYQRNESDPAPPESAAAEPFARLLDDRIEVQQPIVYDGQTYGSIYLRSSRETLDAQLFRYERNMVLMALFFTGLAVFVVVFLRRTVAKPIDELARVARRITEGDLDSARASESGAREISVLAEGFNQMIDRLDERARDLRRTNATMRALVEASPLAIIGLDAEHVVTSWNGEAERIFELEATEAIGRHVDEVADFPALQDALSRASTRALVSSERQYVRSDGSVMWLGSSARRAGGPKPGVVLVAWDVTERHLAEQALQERELQLQRAQKMEAVGRLAGSVAHDFNNLLTVVTATGVLLRDDVGDDPDANEMLDALENAAARGSALARRLLAFSRPQALAPEVHDLSDVVGDLRRMILSVLGEHVEFELQVPPSDGVKATARCDVGQLEQVILNLILNARDAMPGGGRIGVRAWTSQEGPTGTASNWSVLSVTDDGHGMTPEVQAQVFDAFFTTKARGTGLGLATARDIVRGFGGELTVHSEPGEGATFTIWLPWHDGERSASANRREGPLPTATAAAHLLVVDDQPDLLALAQRILTKAGYTVDTAESAEEALELCESKDGRYDLIVTDVVMTGRSGVDLARDVTQRWPNIVFLFMSGYVGDETVGEVDDHGVALLPKPFTPATLLARVAEGCKAGRTHRPSAAAQ